MIRTTKQAPEFTAQLEKLGNIRLVDESLRGVLWGIQTQAEKYKLIPGFRTIRMAKDWRLKLGVVFQIQGSEVELKWIEPLDAPSIFDDEDEDDEPEE